MAEERLEAGERGFSVRSVDAVDIGMGKVELDGVHKVRHGSHGWCG